MRAIDLFAGIGGNTLGATMAGIDVIWAANHSRTAVDFHLRNHPGTQTECQDLRQKNFNDLPDFDLLLASPCCQGHTPARGKEGPHHDESRSTAWAVVDCLEAKRPYSFMVENVKKFMEWNFFPEWRSCVEKLGYVLSFNLLDAADFGIPQNRERLYIIGTRSRHTIELKFDKKSHVPVSTVIDFGGDGWSPIYKPGRSKATLARIENGRRQLKTDRFVTPYYGSGSGLTGRSIDRPIGTITTVDKWAVINGDRMRMCNVPEYVRMMSFPDDIVLPEVKRDAVKLLGNATCPEKICAILTEVKRVA